MAMAVASSHRNSSSSSSAAAAEEEKKVADRYLKREQLGEGTYGVVFKALDTKVFARWYRAPELLFGTKQYGSGVDMWAAGCIFAELLLRKPFMPGVSDIDQLGKIFANFGTPKTVQWPDMVYLPDYIEFQQAPAPPLRSLFPMASDDALDLLSKMFAFDPKARISAQQALEHRYFSTVPAPTYPALLPKVPRKGEPANHKPSEFASHDAPLVLSPSRKMRRVTPLQGRFEGNAHDLEKIDEHAMETRHVGEATGPSGNMPMSMDIEAMFSSQPAPRPTLNSADRSHLKRKLDLDPEFGYSH